MTSLQNLLLKIEELDKLISTLKVEAPHVFEKIEKDYIEIKKLHDELIENNKLD